MTAPPNAGTYMPQYQMVWDSHQWFGQVLTRTVTVTGSVYVDAAVVSTTIPSTMAPGQDYNVVVRMKNTGTMRWSETNTIRLGALGDAALFGPGRIKIPAGTTVQPGQTHDFIFTMTAPLTLGTYTTQYQMVWEGNQWFGQVLTRTVTMNIDAEVVSDTIPSTMAPGQPYNVVVKMKNTGTIPWSEADTIRLGVVGDGLLFGPDRIKIPAGITVEPGDTYDFSFTMTAPPTLGTYTPQYRMTWDGHQWFGQVLTKTVTTTGYYYVDAMVVSDTIPSTMAPGQNYNVGVKMKNTGVMPWSEFDTIRLGALGDAALFGPDRITIPAATTVAPGETYEFRFTMTAPLTAGTYTTQYRMAWDGHQWFGQVLTKTVTVAVSSYMNTAGAGDTIASTNERREGYSREVRNRDTGTAPESRRDTLRSGDVGTGAGMQRPSLRQ
jgi:hypothetical protein